jgi:hypothetical protein
MDALFLHGGAAPNDALAFGVLIVLAAGILGAAVLISRFQQ